RATATLALASLAGFYMHRGKPDGAIALAEQALKMGDESGNRAGALMALDIASWAAYSQGRFAIGLAYAEQAIALYDPLRAGVPWWGANHGVSVLGTASTILCNLGKPDRALARAREATALARTLDHPFSLALALAWETNVCLLRRETEAQRERAR